MASNADSFSALWAVVGDFNDIFYDRDKCGGNIFKTSSSRGLTHFRDTQRLVDLGFQGSPDTWRSGRQSNALIMERLDRGIANGLWRLLFPRATITHCTRHASDQSPILLNTAGEKPTGTPRSFRFELVWVQDPSSHQAVKDAGKWNCQGSPTFQLT